VAAAMQLSAATNGKNQKNKPWLKKEIWSFPLGRIIEWSISIGSTVISITLYYISKITAEW
jgi:hypothetical protein